MNFVINHKALIYSIMGGLMPALFWLWFWFSQEDKGNKRPIGAIALAFLMGAILVIVAIWMEKLSALFIEDPTLKIVVWAAIEETLKFAGIAVIIFNNGLVRKPIGYPMYFIATALGFASLENILYLMNSDYMSTVTTITAMITGNLRFLGSTLLHAISSGMIGSAIGLSFYSKQYRFIYVLVSLVAATLLHSIFNFFIMKGSGENFLSVFGFLWVVAIINILIFEKLRRMEQHGESTQ